MKKCPNCNTEIETNFDACWNCSYDFSENRVPKTGEKESRTVRTGTSLKCLRCGTPMIYLGVYDFHEGTRAGVFGNLFEMFVNRESFNIHACPNCRKAEFFISG